MARILSKSGITTGETVKTGHVTQSIDAFTGIEEYAITLSGSFTMTGGSITGVEGVTNSLTASSAITASYAITASHALNSGASSPSYYNLTFSQFSPQTLVDETTYYLGNSPTLQTAPTRPTPPKALADGTITVASLTYYQDSPFGTSENADVYIMNLTTGFSQSVDTIGYNQQVGYADNTGGADLSLSVSAGDSILFKIINPEFATDPTDVTHTGTVLIEMT